MDLIVSTFILPYYTFSIVPDELKDRIKSGDLGKELNIE